MTRATGSTAGERAAWTGRAQLAWWIPLVLAAIGAVLVIAARSPIGAIPVALLLLLYLALGWIRVSVDARGLRIRYGLLRPGERAAWTGRAHLAWWLPLVLIAIGAVFVVTAHSVAAAVPAALLVILYLALGWIRVSVDVRGLRIRYGLLPWPVTSVPLNHIRRAERIDLAPFQWGGWGYRGSRKAFSRAAVVLRGGDAIRLQLTDGSEFAVTVDDASTGAAVLADLLARKQISGLPPA